MLGDGRRHPDGGPERNRLRRWFAAIAGILGTLLGAATNLYSSEFRHALEASGRELNSTVLSVLLAAGVASLSTTIIYWALSRRKQPAQIVRDQIKINTEVLRHVSASNEPVVGRSLHYLEAKRESEDLVVFLHGLGLDAYDFRPYLAESKRHCVALTLYGFNIDERADDHYKPISLTSHVHLLAYALAQLRKAYPTKRITLVGFSFGADIILFLAELAADALRDIRIHQAVLLDPNVNSETTTISSKIAALGSDRPLEQLVKIMESATTEGEFRYLCEYLYKITSKNFGRIQRHAQDVVGRWQGQEYDHFLNYVGQLIKLAKGVHVVFSFNYERFFNAVVNAATARGLDEKIFECTQVDHFELIGPGFLKDQLEGLL